MLRPNLGHPRGRLCSEGAAPTHQIFSSRKDRAAMHEMPGSRLCSLSSLLDEFRSVPAG